ncbi:MAG: hypothetical protein KF873_15295 [Gemmataceae bacterium]|nr:hypothetical protein [Gemmataceae bacterium]
MIGHHRTRAIALAALAVGLGIGLGWAADKPMAEPQKGPPAGKGPMGKGPMGKGGQGKDAAFATDRDTFHFLLENHKAITRNVKKLDNGVETVTESEKPEVAKKIQEHVPAMYERLKSGKGVRYWDPLFAEAFKHGKKMKMEITNTAKGVKVVETSDNADVVKIIQAHAEVVSQFVKNGFDEAHKEHPVPGSEKKK